ncbi:hypothetical protein BDW68DRAFT_179344 [Aspergillus falconensis]
MPLSTRIPKWDIGYRPVQTAINNGWAIQMDSERHPNLRVFDTTQFSNDKLVRVRSRHGPGMPAKAETLSLALAGVSVRASTLPNVGADGMPVTTDIDDLGSRIAVQSAPFNVAIESRSSSKARILHNGWVECEEALLDRDTYQWKEVPGNTKLVE